MANAAARPTEISDLAAHGGHVRSVLDRDRVGADPMTRIRRGLAELRAALELDREDDYQIADRVLTLQEIVR